MSEHDLEPLSDDIQALVHRSRGLEAAPSDAKSRVLTRVEVLIGPPPGGGGGGSSQPRAPSSAAPGKAGLRLLRRLLPLAASFVLGGGLTAWWLSKKAADAVPPPTSEAPSSALATTTGPAAQPEPMPPAPSRLAPTLADPPAPLTGTRRSASPAIASNEALAQERRLLDEARHALEREDPAAALGSVARHERDFPGGVLVQEREAIAIRALAMLGRSRESRSRLERFRSRFPGSLLLPTIESAVGASSAR